MHAHPNCAEPNFTGSCMFDRINQHILDSLAGGSSFVHRNLHNNRFDTHVMRGKETSGVGSVVSLCYLES